MIVKPLGTVSPYCKDSKNCPGFLIIDNDYKILLDCGNGISRLLNMPSDLENLIIIISHLHKDHYSDLSCLGYASFVYKNLNLLKNKIKVYIPNDSSLDDYNYLMNFGKENNFEFITYSSKEKIRHGDMTIEFNENPHQLLTYSAKIINNNHSLVYSSDTGYSNNCLETFAKDCDLLICESSFLKGQLKRSDNHLYAYEAALIAKKANVKKLALTHFWPEIKKRKYVKEARKIFKNTIACKERKNIIMR